MIKRPESKQPLPENAKCVYKGNIFQVYEWQQEMYDGTFHTFEKVVRPDTAVVIPILDDGRILLTKQEQPGKLPYIAAAGGRIDEGEDPLSAAHRELEEETGYKAKDMNLWFSVQPISKMDWAVYTFIAKGLKSDNLQNLDSGEKIDLYPVTFNELIQIIAEDRFTEIEMLPYFYKALLDTKKMEELRKIFSI
ncbi:NUDIX hydrolase [Candidatus Nomurabacteria bacterium]|nr:NUDIX hydrolase [Candidatus Nomurabacteria bacterium]MCB9820539.1 NUDIX hydrolase [Candidatus Nomurabacteria bacterium]